MTAPQLRVHLFLPLIIKQLNPRTRRPRSAGTPVLRSSAPRSHPGRRPLFPDGQERRYLVIAAAGMAAVGLTRGGRLPGQSGVAMLGCAWPASGVRLPGRRSRAMATTWHPAPHAAVGVAVVNSIGNLGGSPARTWSARGPMPAA